jgi:hypothetical protein
MQPVIAAQRDPRRRDGTELWHIPRIGNGQPLCGAEISGRVRKSKMETPNCNTCRHYDKPWEVRDELYECLLEVHARKPITINDKRWRYSVSRLIDADYVKVVGTIDLRMTMRGRVVVKDILEPSPWWDRKRRVLHARRPLAAHTRCNLKLGEIFTTWDLKVLADKERERRDSTITCIGCLGARA